MDPFKYASPRIVTWKTTSMNDLMLSELSFTDVPVPPSQLYLVLNPREIDAFQSQQMKWCIWKTRMLIYKVSWVLASPEKKYEKIFVIYPCNRVADFLQALEELQLMVGNTQDVTNNMYEKCLFYTLQARIAPYWNRVSDLLIEGKNFVNCDERMNAIRLKVKVNKKESHLTLECCSVLMPLMKIDDVASKETVAMFTSHKINMLKGNQLDKAWCHVLPSTKNGFITSITRQIPKGSIFNNYSELKQYWMNTYGFLLPEETGNIFYYNIKFGYMGSTIFTYPDICVRSTIHIKPLHENQEELTNCLLNFLQYNLPTICEQTWCFENDFKLSSVSLLPGTSLLTNSFSEVISIKQEKLDNDPKSTLSTSESCPTTPNFIPLINSILPLGASITENLNSSISTGLPSPNIIVSVKQEILSGELNDSEHEIIPTQESVDNYLSNTNSMKINPQFTKSKPSLHNENFASILNNNNSQSNEGIFDSSFSNSSGPVLEYEDSISNSSLETTSFQSSILDSTSKIKPIFISKVQPYSTKWNCSVARQSTSGSIKRTKAEGIAVSKIQKVTENEPVTINTDVGFNFSQGSVSGSDTVAAKVNKLFSVQFKGNEADMRCLVKSEEVSKLKVQELSDWLRGHDVKCSARSKKSELVEKVKEYLKRYSIEV